MSVRGSDISGEEDRGINDKWMDTGGIDGTIEGCYSCPLLHGYSVLAGLSWLVLAALSWFPFHDCPVRHVIMSYSSHTILAYIMSLVFLLSFLSGHLVLAFLSW
jgi:hypothetical protein